MPETAEYDPYVRELQTYLRVIAQRDPGIPKVTADGIFGSETTAAVKAFQYQSGLEPTGEVDVVTWTAIFREYERIRKDVEPGRPFSPYRDDRRSIVLPGQAGTEALYVQTILAKLADVYVDFDYVKPTGVNDSDTQEAVRKVQKAAGTKRQDGAIDKDTWNAVVGLHEIHSDDME